MTKNQIRKFLIDLALRFAVLFTVVIILLSIAGLILAHINLGTIEIFITYADENPGLPYSYLLILACIIFIITLISFLVEYLIKKNKNRYDELFKKKGIYRKKKLT
jgi:putative copper export protein